MKALSLLFALLALALAAGCAQQSSPNAMGAAASSGGNICRDGYMVPHGASCGDHGGFERQVGTPPQTQ